VIERSRTTVSVVIPCYNAQPFIGEAITSALDQTQPPAEVIVVDDASTDDSAAVAESFGRRVTVIRRPHSGVSATRNAGIAIARGDLIASLDADDIWELDKLEHQVPLFRDAAVGLVYGQHRRFGPRIGTTQVGWPTELPEGDVFERLYLQRNFVPCSSVLVRRQALHDAGGFDEQFSPAADLDAWLRVALHWRFAAVHRVVCGYRQYDEQMSAKRAGVVRCGLRVRANLAMTFEQRTGMSSAERQRRLARVFLEELSGMISKRNLQQARALASVLEEAFASATPDVRRAIARHRRLAALPRPALWLRDRFRRAGLSLLRVA
jgi:glycosyltransferase involved in cell wall biosynthesis